MRLRSFVGFCVFLAAAGLGAEDAYEIGAGDILHIVVLSQADMTSDFPVDAEGMLTFPVLGKVKASGMSIREFEKKLTTLLSDGFLKKPQVSVAVKEYQSQRVFVTGEIGRPGPYALKGDRSLLALLGEVGSPTISAGHEVIVIRPPEIGGEGPEPSVVATAETALPGQVPGAEVMHINLLELQAGNPEKNITLRKGDTIYVPKAAQVYITGQVAKPGPIRYEQGMTVLQALTIAGGVTDRGSSGRIRIVRVIDGQSTEVKVKMTDVVQPGDTIKVPERFF